MLKRELLLKLLTTLPEAVLVDAINRYKSFERGISFTGNEKHIRVINENDLTSFFDVTLENTGNGLRYKCTCPVFAEKHACRHLAFATIKVLNARWGLSLADIKSIVINQTDIAKTSLNLQLKNEQVTPGRTLRMDLKTKKPPAIATTTARSVHAMPWKSISSVPKNIMKSIYVVDPFKYPVKFKDFIDLLQIDENEVICSFQFVKRGMPAWHPQIKFDRENMFYYRCDCSEATRICSHVKTAFEYLDETYSGNFFTRFQALEEAKNKLLAPYGFTVNDPEAETFSFFKDLATDQLKMKPPSWLWKGNLQQKFAWLQQQPIVTTTEQMGGFNFDVAAPVVTKAPETNAGIGILFNFSLNHFKTGFDLCLIKITGEGNTTEYNYIDLHKSKSSSAKDALPKPLLDKVLKFADQAVKKYLADNGFSHLLQHALPFHNLDKHAEDALRKYFFQQVLAAWPPLLQYNNSYVLMPGKQFRTNHIAPIRLSDAPISLSFKVIKDEKYITIIALFENNGKTTDLKSGRSLGDFFYLDGANLSLLRNFTDVTVARLFGHGFIKIPVTETEQAVRYVISYLMERYKVTLPENLQIEKVSYVPAFQLLVKEVDNKFMFFYPQVNYGGTVVDCDYEQDLLIHPLSAEGKILITKRETRAEKIFFNEFRQLHPLFQKPTLNKHFHLPFEETMKKRWFLEMVVKVKEQGVEVTGIDALNRHRYNTNIAEMKMQARDSKDWFDVNIRVTYGDQQVTAKEILQAVILNEDSVLLPDGTYGMIPEEWLKDFTLLARMAEAQKDGSLKVNKIHFTLIDVLHQQLDNDKILEELKEKKLRLQKVDEIVTVAPPAAITATLRPYQEHGFRWLQTLDELGWGGCLADDMGLGKTLQMITFIYYLKEKYPGTTHLVICPTSLIYNWESEMKKFAPNLKYHIYYGTEREFTDDHFNDYDVILTSYGVARNDVGKLVHFEWHYIILDESQAIKNPDAQVNKALQLLSARNRMIMSGTPLQNNTFDLFAQFNFINPGLLGKRDFFREEFANPIDKNGNTAAAAALRQLVYPFILRRTKTEVAPDLPDKTEIVLWCEMGKEQRALYDEFRNHYRMFVLNKIKEQGLGNSGLLVLEGLLRLRQICDSPQLLKEKNTGTTESAKLDELMREIEENTGGHKLLVFSQFTEMLHIIEERLLSEQIEYVYLDGSTPAEKRKLAVDRFQNEPQLRIFLISLKAGGVGLNLTAADYVYLVDPWWNPAAEQQAIDRTHRIGQTNKVFAYKMICKDSVEEKILQMQERKQLLSSEIIGEDAGFVKKLTVDDVAFLFS